MKTNTWRLPHPLVLLFFMLCLAGLASYVIPAGQFARTMMDGRERVVEGSFQFVASDPLNLMELLMALPLGFKSAVDIIFIVLASGIMFGFMHRSGALEHSVAGMIRRIGLERRTMLVVLLTFVFGMFGVFIGYENNIALIPIAALISLAIGGDLLLAAGISVGAITVGFALSPVNPYTVGTGHRLAELPLFSGAEFRALWCLIGLGIMAYFNVRYFNAVLRNPEKSLGFGLSTEGFQLSKPLQEYKSTLTHRWIMGSFVLGIVLLLYGVFVWNWYINQLSALFCGLAILMGLIQRLSMQEFGEVALRSVAEVAPGAFMVGFAASIRIALETAQLSDTIAFYLSESLKSLPLYASAVAMTFGQSLMNFVIPSGSGQALATLPVMIPVGELLGLTRQTTVLAFQIGDGVTNLINPALGGLVAMLSLCRVPFDRWLKFIFWPFLWVYLMSLMAVVISVAIGYGPF